MTAEEIAKKIVSNPNGYTADSVTVAQNYLALGRILKGSRDGNDWRVVQGEAFYPFLLRL